MNPALASPAPGMLAASGTLSRLAVRVGLALAGWGLRHATRRRDRDRRLMLLQARAAARAALDERDTLFRSAGRASL